MQSSGIWLGGNHGERPASGLPREALRAPVGSASALLRSVLALALTKLPGIPRSHSLVVQSSSSWSSPSRGLRSSESLSPALCWRGAIDLSALKGRPDLLPLTRGTQGGDRSHLESPVTQGGVFRSGCGLPFFPFLPGSELHLHFVLQPLQRSRGLYYSTFSTKACLGSWPTMVRRSIQCRLRSNAFKVGQGFS